MKKFIAVGIVTLGGFGLIGAGAGAAFAAPHAAPLTAAQQVCASANAQINSQANALTAATTANTAATSALAGTTTAVAGAETAYVTDAMAVVSDVDNFASATQLAADKVTFNNATSAFVTAVVNQSAASVASFNSNKTFSQLTLQNKLLTDLVMASC